MTKLCPQLHGDSHLEVDFIVDHERSLNSLLRSEQNSFQYSFGAVDDDEPGAILAFGSAPGLGLAEAGIFAVRALFSRVEVTNVYITVT